MKKLITTTLLATITLLACKKNEKVTSTEPAQEVYLDLSDTAGVYLNGRNRTEFDRKAALGRVLFYDSHLSLNNAVSCASCHKQQFAFADDVALSRGLVAGQQVEIPLRYKT